ncbi:MAG: hypothetical protein EBR09_16025 [Proteobacteria bacterium]|nr:hypothetical protein [Pseudomonadota bacterium]
MNRILLLILCFSLELSALAKDECEDLSHVRTFLGTVGKFVYTQDGCNGWRTVQVVDGEPVTEPQSVVFDGERKKTVVDDEHESYVAENTWEWAETPKEFGDILVHGYFYDGTNKKTGVRSLVLMTELFSREGEFVSRGGSKVRTDIQPDGSKATNVETFDDKFPVK